MKSFFRSVVAGYIGLLFPLIMTLILLEKFNQLLLPLIHFIKDKLHVSRIFGVLDVLLITVLLMLVLGYLCGILIKTEWVKRQVSKWEDKVLGKIPLYNLIKSLLSTEVAGEGGGEFRPALLTDERTRSLCYVTSESDEAYCVYVCEGGLGGGELKIVPKDMIRILNIPLTEFTRLIKQYGVNSARYADLFLNK